MATFNILKLSEDRKSIVIDCATDTEASRIEGVYLEYFQNRNVLGMPSDVAYPAYQRSEGGISLTEWSGTVYEEQVKHPDFKFPSFEKAVTYVYVVTSVPGDDEERVYSSTMGIVVDWDAVYETGMKAVAQLAHSCRNKCESPMYFEQFVVLFHALYLAIEAKDADMIDRLWGRFISYSPDGSYSGSACNCK